MPKDEGLTDPEGSEKMMIIFNVFFFFFLNFGVKNDLVYNNKITSVLANLLCSQFDGVYIFNFHQPLPGIKQNAGNVSFLIFLYKLYKYSHSNILKTPRTTVYRQ